MQAMNMYKEFAGNEPIGFNNQTFLSERDSADRNFALAYYLSEYKVSSLSGPPVVLVNLSSFLGLPGRLEAPRDAGSLLPGPVLFSGSHKG